MTKTKQASRTPLLQRWFPADRPERKQIVAVGLLFFVGLAAFAYFAELNVDVPAFKDSASDGYKAVASWIVGVLIIFGSAVLIYMSVVKRNGWLAALGVGGAIAGLTAVGVTLGVPEILRPVYDLLQAFVDFINLLLKIARKMT